MSRAGGLRPGGGSALQGGREASWPVICSAGSAQVKLCLTASQQVGEEGGSQPLPLGKDQEEARWAEGGSQPLPLGKHQEEAQWAAPLA